jgi:chemotaxis protein MotB
MPLPARQPPEGLPDWIMSYADMITILMAFFVVMYAMAGQKDSAKEDAVFQSLRNQFGVVLPGWGLFTPAASRHDTASPANLGNRAANDSLKSNGQRRPHAPWPGEPARVGGVIFFTDDQTALTDAQVNSLKRVASEIAGKPQKIEIRGHASSREGGVASSHDRWDLAYARCRRTMEDLVALGIDPRRIRLGVAGENEPILEGGAPSPSVDDGRVEVFMLNEVDASHRRATRSQQ